MDYEVVPEILGCCLGHLRLGHIGLGVSGEMVCHDQDVFFLNLTWFQAQVVDVHQFQGMGGHNIFHGGLLLVHP